MILYNVEPDGSISAELAREASAIIKQYCLQRDSESASCCDCPILNLCGTEPYTWELTVKEEAE